MESELYSPVRSLLGVAETQAWMCQQAQRPRMHMRLTLLVASCFTRRHTVLALTSTAQQAQGYPGHTVSSDHSNSHAACTPQAAEELCTCCKRERWLGGMCCCHQEAVQHCSSFAPHRGLVSA